MERIHRFFHPEEYQPRRMIATRYGMKLYGTGGCSAGWWRDYHSGTVTRIEFDGPVGLTIAPMLAHLSRSQVVHTRSAEGEGFTVVINDGAERYTGKETPKIEECNISHSDLIGLLRQFQVQCGADVSSEDIEAYIKVVEETK